MQISARNNPAVQRLRRLFADAKERRESGKFALEGARLCGDAALSGVAVEEIFCTEKAEITYADRLRPLIETGAAVCRITPEIAAYVGETSSPQGLFCICRMPENVRELGTSLPAGRYVGLEDLQDPGNLGTVIRTAEAFGIDGLILSAGCCDPFNPKVLRGSMGGVFRLPIYRTVSMEAAVKTLQPSGLPAYACVVDHDAEKVTAVDFGENALCLIGNEGNGLRPETAAACARQITIPMSGRAESLNASMAAGLVMWEMVRR